ncbi:bifunctional LLM class flavin-dependent oxidoreductase/SDR family oxidoreductase [Corallococcus macrosporus]|uniref:Short-chain dehydrogenase/reductase SDR n=1 Tax=Myxococcus fulvus (strain ATCC BAA-855 / HW-1) TaxID=483219 RepID=F8CI87_MYXFH|nr:bifunctional LLM class flavin-dependent oxidoreductase/SDR family oxidoreductase [Corallococcus macrosporus]AEI63746.1 short-chain dehydrogenase/reductase SDR [Corallococcus macrosporus]
MRFSLMFFASDESALSGRKYELVIESARFADRHGFQGVWVPERHFSALGSLYPNPAVLHAALARETKHLRLNAGSVVLPLHHPLRVAEEWAMVDNLSGGRVGVSFATGWNPDDFALAPERYAERSRTLFEQVDVVRRLWRGAPLAVRNGTGEPSSVRVYPTPVQRELPVWITAASNPATFARAGELGFNLLTHLLDQGVERLAEQVAAYRQARARAGHDPDGGTVTLMLHTFVGGDAQQVRDLAREPYCAFLKSNLGQLKGLAQSRMRDVDLNTLSEREKDDFVHFLYERFATSRAFIGTPDSCMDLAVQLRDLGVDELASLLDFGPPVEAILQNLPHLDTLRARVAELGPRDAAPRGRPAAAPPAPEPAPRQDAVAELQARLPRVMEGADFYAEVAASGAEYGPTMRSLERVWRGEGEALGRLRMPPAVEGERDAYAFHPVLLDSSLLILGALAPERQGGRLVALPTGMRRLRIHAPPTGELYSHVVRTSPPTGSVLEGDVRILDASGELLAEVSGLRIQLMEQAERPTSDPVDALTYALDWRPRTAPAPDAAAGPGTWWVLMDGRGVGKALATRLEARGDTVVRITAGATFQSLGPRDYQVAPGDAAQLRRLVEALLVAGGPVPRGLVHLWSLDGVDPAQTTVETLEAEQTPGALTVLGLVQALVGSGAVRPPRLWLVTRGCQPPAGASGALASATLWGLGRVVSAEHPEVWGGLVDLEPDAPGDASAAALCGVLLAPGGEDQFVLRGEAQAVARLARRRGLPSGGPATRLRADAGYLLTGGLGDLGLGMARWMVERGARHLVLMGRSPLPPREDWAYVAPGSRAARQVAAIRELEALGARVYPAAVDVADRDAVATFLRGYHAEGGPALRGVLHSAGVIQPATLMNLGADALHAVLRPKVAGAWVLHALLEDTPLDFFVLISAVPGLVGWIGSGASNYAAANTFLDALAHHRRARGLPALSVDYGPWSEVGLAVREGGLPMLERQGIGSMSPPQGLAALDRALTQPDAQLAVASLDWPRFFRAFAHARTTPLLAEQVKEAGEGAEPARSPEAGALQAALSEAQPGARSELVREYLRTQVARVLARSSARLDVNASLMSLGLDSLMSIDLRNRIESDLGVVIPMVNLLRGPSIAQLVDDVLPALTLAGAETEMEEVTL